MNRRLRHVRSHAFNARALFENCEYDEPSEVPDLETALTTESGSMNFDNLAG